MILDEQLPEWHVRERHSVRIAVAPADALAAARAVTANEVPVLLVLMGLRSLPAAIARRSRRRVGAPLLDDFRRMGFAPLADSPEELAYGGVGRFWQPSGGLLRVPAGEFAGFAEPGYAKAGFDFRAEPDGHGALRPQHRDARVRHRRRGSAPLPPLLDADPARQRTDPPELAGCHQDARGADSPLAEPARNSSRPLRASFCTFERRIGVQPSASPAGPSACRAHA